jgi:hypothetical protein
VYEEINGDYIYKRFCDRFRLAHQKYVPLTKSYLIFYRKLKPTEEDLPTSIEVKRGEISKTYYPLYDSPHGLNDESAVSYVKPEDIKDLNKRHICVTPRKVLIKDFLNLLTFLRRLLKQKKFIYDNITEGLSLFVKNVNPVDYPELVHRFTLKNFLPFIFKHLYYLDNINYRLSAELKEPQIQKYYILSI